MTVLDRHGRELMTVPQPVAAKAVTGAGVWAMQNSVPLDHGRTDTTRFMKRAQEISHRSPWVDAAERTISDKFGTIGWHLEDQDGEEIKETGAGPVADFRRLIERPNPRMTRRHLWTITCRHLGICGNGFWYLDQLNGNGGAPLAIYYINPARMTPVVDRKGNLTRWALDAEDEFAWGSGVPLEIEEVLHFVFTPPDWGHMGHGLIEAALTKIDIGRYADRFQADMFAAGGKRGGIASAKDGILPDDVFQGIVAGFRNVAEAPDATKRTIVTQGAVDYKFTSATPNEMELNELLSLNRDDIMGIWGVPLSQRGIMTARGLNSGETVKYEEAALWQNAIHTRVVAIWETIQYQLIDRINPDWQLVLEEPAFDDQKPLFELADLAKSQPLKNRERRDLIGLEPFGDERDEEIWIVSTMTRIYPEPEEPEVVPTAPPAPTGINEEQDEAEDDAEDVTRAKAKLGPLAAIRAKVEAEATPDIKGAVGRFLARAKAEALRYAAHMARKPKDTSMKLGRAWDDELAKVLLPKVTSIATEVAGEVRRVVPKAAKADPFEDAAVQYVQTRGGERITGINATTREAVLAAVADTLEDAIAEGLGPDEVSDLLSDRIEGLAVWNEARADMIARTETMFAYNDAALTSYRELAVGQVQALDGDKDAECAERDGKVFSIDDAFSIADHPNGTLDWAPVV